MESNSSTVPEWAKEGLYWDNLTYTVSVEGEGDKDILIGDYNSCYIGPEEFVAILGPSGAGKTTLANLITYRTRMDEPKIYFEGRPIGSWIRSSVGFVPQFDVLPPYSTVREILEFSVILRLGDRVTEEERNATIDNVLTLLHLEHIQDRLVGEMGRKGSLTLAERRRLSSAREIVSGTAQIYVFDEPTSGLQSSEAIEYIRILRGLSKAKHPLTKKKMICIATIHQPSSDAFSLFERLIVMAKGRICFDDYAGCCSLQLAERNLNIPGMVNPADVVIDAVSANPTYHWQHPTDQRISVMSEENRQKWHDRVERANATGRFSLGERPPSFVDNLEGASILSLGGESLRTNDESSIADTAHANPVQNGSTDQNQPSGTTGRGSGNDPEPVASDIADTPFIDDRPERNGISDSESTQMDTEQENTGAMDQGDGVNKYPTSLLTQAKMVFRRSRKSIYRNKPFFWGTVLTEISITVFVTIVFSQAMDESQDMVPSLLGWIIFAIMTHSIQPSVKASIVYDTNRRLLWEELNYFCYEPILLYIADALFLFLFAGGLFTVCFMASYWIIGLNPLASAFFNTWLVLFVCIYTAQALGRAAVTPATNTRVATVNVIVFIQIFFTVGSVLNVDPPGYFIWLRYIGFITYLFGTIGVLQFSGLEFTCESPTDCYFLTGEQVIEFYNFWDVGVLATVFIVLGWGIALDFFGYLYTRHSRSIREKCT